MIHSFVSEHIETLEEIDVEYKELAMKSGIEIWGRVPALGCEATFISDLADAVIESLPYVGAMAVSNLEARQVNSLLNNVVPCVCLACTWVCVGGREKLAKSNMFCLFVPAVFLY